MPWYRRPLVVTFLLPFLALFVAALRTVYFGTTSIETAVLAHVYFGFFAWGVIGIPSFVAGIRRTNGAQFWLLVAAAICGALLLPRVLPSPPEPDYCVGAVDYPNIGIDFVPAPSRIHCRVDVHTIVGTLSAWWLALGCIGWWRARQPS